MLNKTVYVHVCSPCGNNNKYHPLNDDASDDPVEVIMISGLSHQFKSAVLRYHV